LFLSNMISLNLALHCMKLRFKMSAIQFYEIIGVCPRYETKRLKT